jgi:serine/threonine-protein kinase PknG
VTPCNRPHCGGHILSTGFCDDCGRRPLPEAPAAVPPGSDDPTTRITEPPPPGSEDPTTRVAEPPPPGSEDPTTRIAEPPPPGSEDPTTRVAEPPPPGSEDPTTRTAGPPRPEAVPPTPAPPPAGAPPTTSAAERPTGPTEPVPPTPTPTQARGPGGAARHPSQARAGLPGVGPVDPLRLVMADPRIPEERRVCANCGHAIGRSYRGRPGLLDGVCSRCLAPYSFRPKLWPGDLVDDRYAVAGCIDSGGQGYIYLARNIRLDEGFVVLKGLVNSADPEAVELAVNERRALQQLDHPGIVRILDAVTHPDPVTDDLCGYIVMPFVPGPSLRAVIDGTGAYALDRPLTLEDVVACGLEILEAMDYLHRKGLLYCDMKPGNVLLTPGDEGGTPNRIKIVDLGASQAINPEPDRPRLPQVHSYRYSRGEPAGVPRDLLGTGLTLTELAAAAVDFAGWPEREVDSAEPLAQRSFRRLVRRATDAPQRRFRSATELIEQLRGVERELRTPRTGMEEPAPSAVFAPTAPLIDGGLGAAPRLDRWTDGTALGQALSDGLPEPAAVAAGLPVLRVDREDPAATLLARTVAPDARLLVEKLNAYRADFLGVGRSPGLEWQACRAWVELGELARAEQCLAAAGEVLGPAAAGDWRMAWHRGLIALGHAGTAGRPGAPAAADLVARAAREFTVVYDAVPGELAPKLALGYCRERLGHLDHAEPYYEAVWLRDRSVASAAFGLARIRLARLDRAGAVRILDEVPQVSRHFHAARVAAIRVYCGRLTTVGGRSGPVGLPAPADFAEAAQRLDRLYLDEPARARLDASIREAVLDWYVHAGRRAVPPGQVVYDTVADERAIRTALESSLLRVAQQARTEDDHGVLVDLANAARPRTWR